ncbi:hypothetical protein [Paraburkholderia phenoliruptrix]|uniref:hypothetical protein n=1 Tax=Paraburkholderia phenoliruptrix TaxID=252970 RepID=UPI002854B50E|nr:hypothetical protein [Paraburkholderia phenoliruptrix]MDR6389205.1 hypothetical protein [Paraburkholderia phenoliruptrix]
MVRISTLLQWVFMAAASCGLLYGCFFSDWAKRDMEKREAQERADATPHIIREADGCKVYAFKSGDWHYFTRCDDGTVTTERNYTERHGKTTVHKSETIVTQGNS